MMTGQPSRVGTPSGGSRWWYPLALFAALLSLLLALVVAGAGIATASPSNVVSARGAVHTVGTVPSEGQPSEGGDAVASITAISLIPATSKALDGADAAAGSLSVSVSLIPPTSRALPAADPQEVAVRNAAFDRIEPPAAALGLSERQPGIGAAAWLLIALVTLLGGAAVLTVGWVRRRRQH